MKKENRGFTLIELIIAIAVLSVMTGVLLQSFVISRRIDTKSRREEMTQDAARTVMEALKGYSIEKLETLSAAEPTGTVVIGTTEFTYEPLPGDEGDASVGYLLKGIYDTDYLIEAEVDFGRYKEEEGSAPPGSSYTINQYQMPNIADVSSFQNVVLSPELLVRDDEIRMSELLAKVNPVEEETGEEDGSTSAVEPEYQYQEDEIRKVLHIEIGEKEGEKLVVRAEGVYTVGVADDSSLPDAVEGFSDDTSIRFPIHAFQKQIVNDEKTHKPVNRIYVFLPEETEVDFGRIYVTAPDLTEHYGIYIIASESVVVGTWEQDYITMDVAEPNEIELYSNLEGNQPVSLYEAENRLYRLRVTVFEAIDEGAGGPDRGKELLRLDSAKSE